MLLVFVEGFAKIPTVNVQMALKRFFDKKQNITQLQSCTLKAISSNTSDITLYEKAVEIGRSEQTGIKDLFCSKNQLLLKPDFANSALTIKVCGTNASGLNGFAIHRGKIYEAYDGDIIEILYGRYQYKVEFLSPPPIKKIKQETSADMTVEGSWESVENGKLLVYTPHNNKSSEKVGAYDLDGTLIGTRSGKVFPTDIFDWKILYSEIPNKIKSLYNLNFKIVIITNQAGIAKGRMTIDDFKNKVTSIIKRIGVPIQVLASLHEGIYRKPRPGMWTYLEEKCNDGTAICKAKSFFVGDAAGRGAIPPKIKKDFSSADRLFALNIDLPFMTPEEHFLNEKPRQWNLPTFNPKIYDNKKWYSSDVIVPLKEVEVIVLVGLQGSGKSYFARKVLEPLGYTIINRDTIGSMEKCIEKCKQHLKERKSCAIDNTNVDIESRKRFVELAKNLSVKYRCFVMNTSIEHIKHNLVFRQLTEKSPPKINEMIFNSFKKKYVYPTEKEGFSEIVKVNLVPNFKNSNEENLYKMYLVEK